MARVLIAGCGYVGVELAKALAGAGHEVWGLRRRAEGLPDAVRPAPADLTDAASLAALLAGRDAPSRLDLVVYAAAAQQGSDPAYRAAYVEGPSRLLEALDSAGEVPRRIFFTSSTGVYAVSDGSWVDETSPAEPVHFSGLRVLEGERVFATSAVPSTAVRLGGIYGPGRERLIERVRRGEAVCREGPPRYTNRIHRDDAAGALAHLVGRELAGETLAPVYLGVDCEPAEECEVLRWLAARLGVPPPRRVPVQAAAPVGARPLGSKRCRNSLLLASGYRLRFPTFREGYAALLAARQASLNAR